jgi:hypothetical protein
VFGHLIRATYSVNSMPSFKEVLRLGAEAHAAIPPTRKRRAPVRLTDINASVANTNTQASKEPEAKLLVDGTEPNVEAIASTCPADVRPRVSSTSDKRDNIVEKARYTRLSKRKIAAETDAQGKSSAPHKKLKSAQVASVELRSKMSKRKPQVPVERHSVQARTVGLGRWSGEDLKILKGYMHSCSSLEEVYVKFPNRSVASVHKQVEKLWKKHNGSFSANTSNQEKDLMLEGRDSYGVPFHPSPPVLKADGKVRLGKVAPLSEIPTIDVGHRCVLTPAEKKTILDAPIIRIKNLVGPINEHFWNFKDIAENFGQQNVDVLRQNPRDEGFRLKTHFNERQPLHKFLKYYTSQYEKNQEFVRRFTESRRKLLDGEISTEFQYELQGHSSKRPKPATVKYCVNVDMRNWTKYVELLKDHLPPFLHCQGEDDILRFVHQDIEGMTSPQLYLKIPGVWTGGHEENLRFRSINCSHGYGESQWFAIVPEYAKKLRELVQISEDVDIYEEEGRYFPSVKFLRANGIPVMTCYQEPGDCIVLKGGTQHWVRAKGYAVNSSWNFGHGTLEQLQTSFERYEINKSTTVRNIVPLKILTLDYVEDVIVTKNRTFDDQPGLKAFLGNQIACMLEDEMQKWQAVLRGFKGYTIAPENREAVIVLCEEHKSCTNCELVSVYVRCYTCETLNKKRQKVKRKKTYASALNPVYRCVDCAIAHHQQLRTHKVVIQEKALGSLERLGRLYSHPYFCHTRRSRNSLIDRYKAVMQLGRASIEPIEVADEVMTESTEDTDNTDDIGVQEMGTTHTTLAGMSNNTDGDSMISAARPAGESTPTTELAGGPIANLGEETEKVASDQEENLNMASLPSPLTEPAPVPTFADENQGVEKRVATDKRAKESYIERAGLLEPETTYVEPFHFNQNNFINNELELEELVA